MTPAPAPPDSATTATTIAATSSARRELPTAACRRERVAAPFEYKLRGRVCRTDVEPNPLAGGRLSRSRRCDRVAALARRSEMEIRDPRRRDRSRLAAPESRRAKLRPRTGHPNDGDTVGPTGCVVRERDVDAPAYRYADSHRSMRGS